MPDGFVGVAIFNFSEYDMAAVKWAMEYLRRLNMLHPFIIRIKKLDNNTPPQEGKTVLNWYDIEEEFEADCPEFMKVFQTLAHGFDNTMKGRIFTGGHLQETLQYAINKVKGLDTLVLGWAPAKDGAMPHAMEQVNMLLTGCTIVLPKIDFGAQRALSLSAADETPNTASNGPPPSGVAEADPPVTAHTGSATAANPPTAMQSAQDVGETSVSAMSSNQLTKNNESVGAPSNGNERSETAPSVDTNAKSRHPGKNGS